MDDDDDVVVRGERGIGGTDTERAFDVVVVSLSTTFFGTTSSDIDAARGDDKVSIDVVVVVVVRRDIASEDDVVTISVLTVSTPATVGSLTIETRTNTLSLLLTKVESTDDWTLLLVLFDDDEFSNGIDVNESS